MIVSFPFSPDLSGTSGKMQGFRFACGQGYEFLDIPRASPAAAFLVNP